VESRYCEWEVNEYLKQESARALLGEGIPQADWIHIIATTRLGENELFARHKDRAFLAVDELLEDDAVALIEAYQPKGQFADASAGREAASEIVQLPGGFTLAVEVAAVYLGEVAGLVSCASFRDRLKPEGLCGLERAGVKSGERVRHGEQSLIATLRPTLDRLDQAERFTLALAAFLPADHVALPWLRAGSPNRLSQAA
jgi:hypothetical protein